MSGILGGTRLALEPAGARRLPCQTSGGLRLRCADRMAARGLVLDVQLPQPMCPAADRALGWGIGVADTVFHGRERPDVAVDVVNVGVGEILEILEGHQLTELATRRRTRSQKIPE